MVVEKEGHGRSRANGAGPDFMGIEAEGGATAEEQADAAEEGADMIDCEETGARRGGVGASRGGGAVVRNCCNDPLDDSGPSTDGAELGVARPVLSPRVRLVTVLLVSESNGDRVCKDGETGVMVGEKAVIGIPEGDVSKGDTDGTAGEGCDRILARPHGEEEGANDEIGCVGVGGVGQVGGTWLAVGEKAAEEFRGDGALSVRCGVPVVVGTEELADAGEKLGAVREVTGARLETTPKRRSQVACGSADSCCHQLSWTLSNNSA